MKVIIEIGKLLKKYWIIKKIILQIIAFFYAVIIAVCGDVFGLVKEGSMTIKGWIVTVCVFVAELIIVLSEEYFEKYYEDYLQETKYYEFFGKISKIEKEKELLQRNCIASKEICNRKIESQIEIAKRISEGSKAVPTIYTDPTKQLNIILDKLVDCFACLVKNECDQLEREHFSASILYSFAFENPVKWRLINCKTPTSVDATEIMKDGSRYTARYLMDRNECYVMMNKQSAFEESKYVPDNSDTRNRGKLTGSIFCIQMHFGDTSFDCVKAILTVDSRNYQFVPDDIKDNEDRLNRFFDNIYRNVVCNFEKRIGVELFNLYMITLSKKSEISYSIQESEEKKEKKSYKLKGVFDWIKNGGGPPKI